MESLPRKIWRTIYPAVLLVVIYLFVYFIAMTMYGNFFSDIFTNLEEFMGQWGSLVSIVALIAGGIVSLLFYRKDGLSLFGKKLIGSSGRTSVKNDTYSGPGFIFRNPRYLALIAVMGILVSHGLSILVSFIGMSGAFGEYTQTAVELSTSGWIITIIKAVILAPIAEELTFRGLCYNRGRKFMGFWGAAVVSSLLFAFYHMNMLQGIMTFMYGIVLCAIYEKFQNVWATIVMHAAANLLSVVLELAGVSYPSYVVYAIVMVICLGGAAAIYFLAFKNVGMEEKHQAS